MESGLTRGDGKVNEKFKSQHTRSYVRINNTHTHAGTHTKMLSNKQNRETDKRFAFAFYTPDLFGLHEGILSSQRMFFNKW